MPLKNGGHVVYTIPRNSEQSVTNQISHENNKNMLMLEEYVCSQVL